MQHISTEVRASGTYWVQSRTLKRRYISGLPFPMSWYLHPVCPLCPFCVTFLCGSSCQHSGRLSCLYLWDVNSARSDAAVGYSPSSQIALRRADKVALATLAGVFPPHIVWSLHEVVAGAVGQQSCGDIRHPINIGHPEEVWLIRCVLDTGQEGDSNQMRQSTCLCRGTATYLLMSIWWARYGHYGLMPCCGGYQCRKRNEA